MDDRLESDERRRDGADGERLDERAPVAQAGQPRAAEAVERDQPEPAPLRHVDRRVDLHHADHGKEEEHARERDAEGDGDDVVQLADHGRAVDAPAHAQLRADELAVELGQADRDRRPKDGRQRDPGRRRVVLDDDDQCQADDRAVDDARDLPAAQVLGDPDAHQSESEGRLASFSIASARWTCAMLWSPRSTRILWASNSTSAWVWPCGGSNRYAASSMSRPSGSVK